MFNEQQEKWLRRTEDLFMRYGIKSITMDDVARELGISKKTLYQFVESKDDLVMQVMQRHIEEEKEVSQCWHRDADNAIEEILGVIKNAQKDLQRIKSNIVFDLQKYHRSAWEFMQNYQRGHMHQMVRANLERGIQEGLYRSDFDIDIIAKLHVAESFVLLDESFFPRSEYPLEVVFREYLLYYLHAIASDRGRELLTAKLT